MDQDLMYVRCSVPENQIAVSQTQFGFSSVNPNESTRDPEQYPCIFDFAP